eukprot:tig00000178_g12795.t1
MCLRPRSLALDELAIGTTQGKPLVGCYGVVLFLALTLAIVIAVAGYSLFISSEIGKPQFAATLDKRVKAQMSRDPNGVCTANKIFRCTGGSVSCFELSFATDMCPAAATCAPVMDAYGHVSCKSRIADPVRPWITAAGV